MIAAMSDAHRARSAVVQVRKRYVATGMYAMDAGSSSATPRGRPCPNAKIAVIGAERPR